MGAAAAFASTFAAGRRRSRRLQVHPEAYQRSFHTTWRKALLARRKDLGAHFRQILITLIMVRSLAQPRFYSVNSPVRYPRALR